MIENLFSWSKSRDEEFRECPRKYFYDRYASWGGWDPRAPKEARAAYVLKNLKNRWAWKGETVHHVIENALKSIRQKKPLPLSSALSQLTEIMRRDFRSSKAKKYLEDPKRNMGFFEHEYERPVGDETWKRIHDESALCVRNFYASPLYQELLGDDTSSWLVVEDLEEYDFDPSARPGHTGDLLRIQPAGLHGVKVYVKLDFARRKNGFIEIYDWKTGKNGAEGAGRDWQAGVQIGTYAIFAMKRWGVPPQNIKAYLVGLGGDSALPEEQPVTEELVAKTREFMRQSIEGMRALLLDPAKNIPKPRENFSFTESTRLCDFCNFYKICEKYNS